jgi:PleD family two-component response regulator
VEKIDVLIIDDDRQTARFYAAVLTLSGLSCEVILSAKEAIHRLAGSVPDLILLDMLLGTDIGGEEILYQIRSNPRFDNTRVVVITAFPTTIELISNMADLVLTKPVEVEQLRKLVGRLSSNQPEPKHLTFRDPVSQLFNKEFFLTRLDLAYQRARRRPDFLFSITLFEVYIPGQELETLKPEVQAGIMLELAGRLRRLVRPMDTIARLNGARFGALHEEIKKTGDIEIIHERLKEMFVVPVKIEDETIPVAARFGTAIYERKYVHPDEVYAAAELALLSETHS